MADFAPGDVVVCVDARTSPASPVVRVKEGRTYRVKHVFHEETWHDLWGTDGGGLVLHGVRSRARAFAANRFRRIDPASEQFIATVRACKPIKQREDA